MDRRRGTSLAIGGFFLGITVVGVGLYLYYKQILEKKIVLSLNEDTVPFLIIDFMRSKGVFPQTFLARDILQGKMLPEIKKYFNIDVV